jgi:ATP/maltotriose-dependent transcriptional regulator MalT
VAHAVGDYHLAQFYLDRAMPLFHEIGIASDVAHVLLEQARVAEAQGLVTQAHYYYAESLEVFARQRMQRVPECLEGIAGLAIQQPTQAAQLLGTAAAIRESTNFPLPTVYRASYERTVAATCKQLGEAAYAAAWAAGHALTLEEAIAEALRVPAEAPPETPDQAEQPVSTMPDRLGSLTSRERQVLVLIAQGASNRAIAEKLVITERTAEIHVSNILGKLGVTSRTQAAAYALANGLADAPDA